MELAFGKLLDANGRIVSPPAIVDGEVEKHLQFLQ